MVIGRTGRNGVVVTFRVIPGCKLGLGLALTPNLPAVVLIVSVTAQSRKDVRINHAQFMAVGAHGCHGEHVPRHVALACRTGTDCVTTPTLIYSVTIVMEFQLKAKYAYQELVLTVVGLTGADGVIVLKAVVVVFVLKLAHVRTQRHLCSENNVKGLPKHSASVINKHAQIKRYIFLLLV
ncbi:uncharacterized protein LOC123555641 isoform X2 [Mercenaria mercenaria]|uniref:uncharacterized protein LOC123555641 isoform X2 n=1 Tax=Mercenaria mercenaria TaxID=6596 RepID=UPI00234EDF3F|nr:uncharacterized protein LOC123555641 isoform X2 [Mercenaria mercenaria]